MKKLFYILLFPFSFLYGLILYIRNKFYDWNVFRSTEFNFPIIIVGNLNLGGVGKTPHVEYLVHLLSNNFKPATLSRGYKRKTAGFILSNQESTVNDIGDEPLQYKQKFNSIPVAVDEKRVRGIQLLKENHPELNVILLDDAFQHRAVKPGINILVTDFHNLYINDTVIPSGRLREWACGSDRANIIIVSKSPNILSPIDKERIKESLNPKPHQEIYFSYIAYGELIPFTSSAKKLNLSPKINSSVLLITGIANPTPLFNELDNMYNHVEHIQYSDHHQFNKGDTLEIKTAFENLLGNNKIIITTEKDIMRLSLLEILNELEGIPIFYIPIEVCFHGNDKEEFDTQILKYVTANSRN